MTALDLLDYILQGKQPALYPAFEDWVLGSRRFKAFAIRYRDKIRAKMKNARDQGGMKDLHAELETAALLLREERFTLEYEKDAASKQRRPDFTVTYKTHIPFNVEVRRIRGVELEEAETEARIGKLMAVLCEKVGQMPPGSVNLLWLTAEHKISHADLTRAVVTLRQLAESKEDFFTRRGFDSAAGFFKLYRRLSGIVLHRPGDNVLWLNPLARHKTPLEIVTAIERLESGDL